METVIAWVLVASSASGGVAVGPPVATHQDCLAIKRVIHIQNIASCVEVKIVK